MGYYTCYSIGVTKKEDLTNDLLRYVPSLNEEFGKALAEINPAYFDKGYGLEEQIEYDSMKWYDHDNDMLKLSKRFPEYLFILRGEGEDSQDLWISYYLNGKKQYCPAKITYDPFDEKALI